MVIGEGLRRVEVWRDSIHLHASSSSPTKNSAVCESGKDAAKNYAIHESQSETTKMEAIVSKKMLMWSNRNPAKAYTTGT